MIDRTAPVLGAASIAQMSALLDTMPVAVVIVAADGRIVSVNERTERLFGYAARSLPGKPVETLLPERFRSSHPAWRASFAAAPQPRAMGAGRSL